MELVAWQYPRTWRDDIGVSRRFIIRINHWAGGGRRANVVGATIFTANAGQRSRNERRSSRDLDESHGLIEKSTSYVDSTRVSPPLLILWSAMLASVLLLTIATKVSGGFVKNVY